MNRHKHNPKAVELLMALGLSAVVVSCSPSTTHQAANTPSSGETSAISEGGEGGEEGNPNHSTHTTSSDSDVNYMVSLGLMKGHLIVAKELMNQGKSTEAEPHIGHPVDELYPEIEGELATRHVKDFKGMLNELLDLVKSKPQDPKVVKLYDQVIQAIDTAILVLPAQKRTSPAFVLQSMNEILKVADEEYAAAIANDKFVALLEYQDSRGFVLYATQLYQSIVKQMDQTKPEVSQTLQTKLKTLATAWPGETPPQAPILSTADVSALIGEIAVVSKK